MSDLFSRRVVLTAALVCVLTASAAFSQDSKKDEPKISDKTAQPAPAKDQGKDAQTTDPLKRPLSEKQRKEQQKALKEELGKSYKKWLDEDVRWIITDEERAAFKQLSNDEERDQFIEQFWLRRDPTPDTVENEYKEEHYRRIAYANEHFAAGIPGWRTDRGRIYVMYGPADEIESHASGGLYNRPIDEGGGTTSTYPFEQWRYRYLEGIGQEIIIEFVDTCLCNEYHMSMDRSEKDALLHVPGGGLTMYEEMGITSKTNRVTGGDGSVDRFTGNAKLFDKLEQFAKLSRPPQVKFKDLEEVVTHKISVNLLPFDVRADFVKVTSDTVLVPVTISIKNKDITFTSKEGVSRGVVNIFGRVTTLTGRVSQTFEDTVHVDVPAELLPKTVENASVYWKALPLKPGRYRMDLVLKDVNGDRVGTWSKGIQVPAYEEDKLASSTLILADQMEKVPSKNVGSGNFVIGTTKVRPRVESSTGKPAAFKRGQKVNFWMQVYNLGIDQQTKKASATIQYKLVNTATNRPVIDTIESTEQLGNTGEQITLEKSLPSANLEPGLYRISIKVDDKVSKQTITPSANFLVE